MTPIRSALVSMTAVEASPPASGVWCDVRMSVWHGGGGAPGSLVGRYTAGVRRGTTRRVMGVALSSATATAMSSWLAPPLLPAVLVMVLLALIPRRRRLLIPVGAIGWATVWIDSRLTADPLDVIGVLVTGVALTVGMLSPGSATERSSDRSDDRV